MAPTLANIGAIAAGAYRMQILTDHQVSYTGIIFSVGPFHLHPMRQTAAGDQILFQSNIIYTKIMMR